MTPSHTQKNTYSWEMIVTTIQIAWFEPIENRYNHSVVVFQLLVIVFILLIFSFRRFRTIVIINRFGKNCFFLLFCSFSLSLIAVCLFNVLTFHMILNSTTGWRACANLLSSFAPSLVVKMNSWYGWTLLPHFDFHLDNFYIPTIWLFNFDTFLLWFSEFSSF